MPTADKNGLIPVVQPNLDRTIRTLEDRRAGFRKNSALFVTAASCFAVAGVLVLVLANAAFRDGSLLASGIAAALLAIAAVLAVIAAVFQTKIAVINRPLKKYRDVRAELTNAGFVYGNHREFFGKFFVFHELDGGRIAIIDCNRPRAPFIAEASEALTLTLDGIPAFFGRVAETSPEVHDFLIHPEYRYRVKSKPIYEQAELRFLPRYGAPFFYAFPFGNAERKQFVSFASYIC